MKFNDWINRAIERKRRGLDLITDASFSEIESILTTNINYQRSSIHNLGTGVARYKKLSCDAQAQLLTWVFDLSKNEKLAECYRGLKNLDSGIIFDAKTAIVANLDMYPLSEESTNEEKAKYWNRIYPYHLEELRYIEKLLQDKGFGTRLFTPNQ